jgi:hypothetical protein
MKYPKAFEQWWQLRKNETPFMHQYVVFEMKRQCHRAWIHGRNYEKEVAKMRVKLEEKVTIESMESDFND